MQTASSRIWDWIANSISHDDNHYTKLPLLKVIYCPVGWGLEVEYTDCFSAEE